MLAREIGACGMKGWLYAALGLVVVVSLIAWADTVGERDHAARVAEATPRLAAADAAYEAKKKLEQAQFRSDVAACSTVVDPIRCHQAFYCRQEPEQCVIEYGDPDIILDYLSNAAMDDAPISD